MRGRACIVFTVCKLPLFPQSLIQNGARSRTLAQIVPFKDPRRDVFTVRRSTMSSLTVMGGGHSLVKRNVDRDVIGKVDKLWVSVGSTLSLVCAVMVNYAAFSCLFHTNHKSETHPLLSTTRFFQRGCTTHRVYRIADLKTARTWSQLNNYLNISNSDIVFLNHHAANMMMC